MNDAEWMRRIAELEQCGKDDDETIRGLIESQNRVAEVVAQQRAEINRLRARNAELVEACEAMVASQEVVDLDERESREGLAFERIEDALAKATKPQPKA